MLKAAACDFVMIDNFFFNMLKLSMIFWLPVVCCKSGAGVKCKPAYSEFICNFASSRVILIQFRQHEVKCSLW